jgi:hypothetical protein
MPTFSSSYIVRRLIKSGPAECFVVCVKFSKKEIKVRVEKKG